MPFKRFPIIPPVCIRGVVDRRMLSAGKNDRDEFPVASVEPGKLRSLRELGETSPGHGRDDDPPAAARIALVVPKPLEEGIARSGLTGGRQMPAVLLKDQPTVVQKNLSFRDDIVQRRDAGQYAVRARLGRFAVCDHRHIGIHDRCLHSAARFFRISAAWLMAAISPNSSPKKSSGQFSMVPKISRCNGIKCDTPFSMEQK